MKYQPVDFQLRDNGERFYLRTIQVKHVSTLDKSRLIEDKLFVRLLSLDSDSENSVLNGSIDTLEKKIQEIADSPDVLLLGLFNDDSLIGGAFIKQEGRFYLEIPMKYRNRGLGTAVLEQLMYFSAKEVAIPYLSCIIKKDNTPAYSILTTMGFYEEAWIDKDSILMEASMEPSILWTSCLAFLDYPSDIRYKAQIDSESEALIHSFNDILNALPLIGQAIQDGQQKLYWIKGVQLRFILIKHIIKHIFSQTKEREQLKDYDEKFSWSNDLTVYISSFINNVLAVFDLLANIICLRTGIKKQNIGFRQDLVKKEIAKNMELYIEEYNRIRNLMDFSKFSSLRNDEGHNIPGYIPLVVTENNLHQYNELEIALYEAIATKNIEEYLSLFEQKWGLLDVDVFTITQHIDDEGKQLMGFINYEEFLINISYLLCGAVCSFASIVLESKVVDGLIDKVKENRTRSLIDLYPRLLSFDNQDYMRNVGIKFLNCDKKW